MSLQIRLSRVGRKNKKAYRLVVMRQRSHQKGRAVEIIGSYNPSNKETKISLERLNYWKGQGAGITQAVKDLVQRSG